MRRPALVLALLLATSAHATEPASEAEARIFPLGVETCFGVTGGNLPRGIGATAITLLRQRAPMEDSEAAAWDRVAAARGWEGWPHPLAVTLVVTLPGERRARSAALSCHAGENDRLACGTDIDGSNVTFAPVAEGLQLIQANLPFAPPPGVRDPRLWQTGDLSRPLLLRRLDGPACARRIAELRPEGLRGPPVIERLASGTTCFARNYDAAHMRRNPRQTIRALRVDWVPPTTADDELGRMRLTARTRSSATLASDLSCHPHGHHLMCQIRTGSGFFVVTRNGDRAITLRIDSEVGQDIEVAGHTLMGGDETFRLENDGCSRVPRG